MGLVDAIMTGDQTRQHAGIGRVGVPTDQRKTNAEQRLHAETFEHGHVAVPPADKHKVLNDRSLAALHGHSAECELFSEVL
jgi:hypothetical protein